jgi:hypothetical protein
VVSSNRIVVKINFLIITATQPVVDTNADDVATGDILRIDCDVAGTGTKGTDVILVFQTP